MKKTVLDRAHAKEIQKILNREGFTSNRGLYKRVREETGVYESGNHNALSIKDALIEEGLVTLPKIAMEALVMSSILDKFNVKEITPEIVDQLVGLGFKEDVDADTQEVFYMRPWTGKIFSRYEEPKDAKKAPKAKAAPKAKKIETFSAKEMAERFKVKQLAKKHKETLAGEGFTAVKADTFPFGTTYVREA